MRAYYNLLNLREKYPYHYVSSLATCTLVGPHVLPVLRNNCSELVCFHVKVFKISIRQGSGLTHQSMTCTVTGSAAYTFARYSGSSKREVSLAGFAGHGDTLQLFGDCQSQCASLQDWMGTVTEAAWLCASMKVGEDERERERGSLVCCRSRHGPPG